MKTNFHDLCGMSTLLKNMIACLCAAFLFVFAKGQQGGTSITGTVTEKGKQPVEFASVVLLSLPDSADAGAAITDNKGRFTLENIKAGNYVLRISFIGLSPLQSKPFSVDGQNKLAMGQFDLAGASGQLEEVVVSGRKSMMNTSIDRKVYNVEQDIMNKTGTASDILRNIPSIEVDIDGVVSLRGSADVMILINGKPTPLMGRSRAEVLQQLPAGSIERIEVITNPSARYRPDGTSGIINIVLKKNAKRGFNGTVTANAGNRHRYNGNLSMNYNPGKVNFFGSYSARQDTRIRMNKINRLLLDSSGQTNLQYFEDNYFRMKPMISHSLNGGINYSIDERNSLDITGNYFTRRLQRNDITTRRSFSGQGPLNEYYDRIRTGPDNEKENLVTVAYEHQFPGENHSLNVEFTMENIRDQENNRFQNKYYYPARENAMDNTTIIEAERQRQLTIDYINQLTETSRLEAGYDGSYNKADYDFYGEAYDVAEKKFIMDSVRSNRFLYDEDLHAVYGTYHREHKNFGYAVGVRLEQAIIKGHLVTLDSFINNRYFKIYPTIHLSYKLSDNKELQLNYSKRVNRPDADELNPFPEYQDPRNLSSGNPALLPEMIHSLEFGFKWQNDRFSIVPSIYYRYEKDGFTSVTIPLNDTVLLTTEQNLGNDQSAGLEVIVSAKAGKWLTANFSTNVFYNRINAINLGYVENKSIISASSTLNLNMSFGKGTMMQFMVNHRSARLTPQGQIYPTIVANAGLRQDLLKGKLSLALTVSDMFKTLRQKNVIETPYFYQTTIGRRDGSIIYAGVSYRFGVKKAEEKMQFDDNL